MVRLSTVGGLVFWWLRYECIETAYDVGLNDHEDDQQHQQDVDQWRDVDIGACSFTAASSHTHSDSPFCRERPGALNA